MRPQNLFPLFAPVTALPGVGPRVAALLEALAGPRIVDLLWHLPAGLIDRRFAPKVADAPEGVIATLTVMVDAHHPPANRRQPYKIICSDETGFVTLVFFHARGDYLTKTLPEGATRVVSGRVEVFRGERQITHPDHVGTLDELGTLQSVEPVYPLTAGLTLKTVGKSVRDAVAKTPDLPEWIDGNLLKQRGWPAWRQAVEAAHGPQDADDLAPAAPARQRLAYDELFASQAALLLVRAQQRRLRGRAIAGDGHLRTKVLASLPFSLTESQRTAIEEITADMAADSRMLRLLQGDVGSGKTMVALMAMLGAVEAGAQAALMAPTEILARQHFQTIEPLARAAGIRAAVLTGRDKGKARNEILAGLASGDIDVVVGTHALFQEDVVLRDLAFAVIDEQHRFGVHQRMALSGKGRTIDILVMTATPIPRTLLLAVYGDIDSSRLTEKPAGRQPVDTRAFSLDRLGDVTAAVDRAVTGGAKAYWICPLVEESEVTDLAAATARHKSLAQRFGDRVGLVHGRMKGPDKDTVMARFASGPVDILVATTVVEVGVDVADATVMVVEHAERFGLAQLHQLRGRVGRGDRPSTCLLLYQGPLGEAARTRIDVMRATDDGFRIAEEDLRLRGGGELLGIRQSGLPSFRLADLAEHANLLELARSDARLALDKDPELTSARGEALRTLLYLFERDQGVRLLRSG